MKFYLSHLKNIYVIYLKNFVHPKIYTNVRIIYVIVQNLGLMLPYHLIPIKLCANNGVPSNLIPKMMVASYNVIFILITSEMYWFVDTNTLIVH